MKFSLRPYFQKSKVKFVNQQNRSKTSGTSHTTLFPDFIQIQISQTVLQVDYSQFTEHRFR